MLRNLLINAEHQTAAITSWGTSKATAVVTSWTTGQYTSWEAGWNTSWATSSNTLLSTGCTDVVAGYDCIVGGNAFYHSGDCANAGTWELDGTCGGIEGATYVNTTPVPYSWNTTTSTSISTSVSTSGSTTEYTNWWTTRNTTKQTTSTTSIGTSWLTL